MPNSSLRWGVLGTARIATKFAAAVAQAAGNELVAVASRDGRRAADWATAHAAARSFDSYAALLDDPEVDAVYIPLPPALHAEWTIRAAERGKHVLCEKPIAMTTAEAEEMAAACRAHNVQLMDGVMWLHHPRTNEMHRFLHDGTLGQLRRVTSAFSFCWETVPEQDIRLQRAMGGGSLLDLGWYCVGAALWAFGDLPQRVFGAGRYERDVDMSFSGLLWFDGNRTASFDSGFETSMRKWFEVAGDKGSLVCDDFARPWKVDKPRFWIHGREGKVAEHLSDPLVQEVCMVESFAAAVRSGQLNDDWPARAIATQRVCEALDRSARLGTVVELQR